MHPINLGRQFARGTEGPIATELWKPLVILIDKQSSVDDVQTAVKQMHSDVDVSCQRRGGRRVRDFRRHYAASMAPCPHCPMAWSAAC